MRNKVIIWAVIIVVGVILGSLAIHFLGPEQQQEPSDITLEDKPPDIKLEDEPSGIKFEDEPEVSVVFLGRRVDGCNVDALVA